MLGGSEATQDLILLARAYIVQCTYYMRLSLRRMLRLTTWLMLRHLARLGDIPNGFTCQSVLCLLRDANKTITQSTVINL